ncbi:MAG: hypothetical protein WDW36_003055 [Sanguina aurantia]
MVRIAVGRAGAALTVFIACRLPARRQQSPDAALRRAQSQQLKHLEARLEKVNTRLLGFERDKKLSEISFAKMVDLKESENHLLDRHGRLQDDIAAMKENIRVMAAPGAFPSPRSSRHPPSGRSTGGSTGPGGDDAYATLSGLRELDAATTQSIALLKEDVQTLDANIIELDKRLMDANDSNAKRMEVKEKVLMKMARQIDLIQGKLPQQ